MRQPETSREESETLRLRERRPRGIGGKVRQSRLPRPVVSCGDPESKYWLTVRFRALRAAAEQENRSSTGIPPHFQAPVYTVKNELVRLEEEARLAQAGEGGEGGEGAGGVVAEEGEEVVGRF